MKKYFIPVVILISVFLLAHPAYADISTGLVGHWKLDGNAGDSSVYGNHGSVKGGASFVSGNIGQALGFDGIDDYVTMPTAYDLTSAASYAFWVKPSGVNWRAIVGNGVNDEGIFLGPFHIVWTPSGFSSVSSLSPGVWNHVVVTMAGGDTKIYIAGALDAQDSSQLIFDVDLIGVDRNPPVDEIFSGELDDIRVYNRELSPADVLELYSYGDPVGTTGTINVQATLDGVGWFGPGTISYEISGPTTFSGDFDVPVAHTSAPEGNYTINLTWPGDWPGVFRDVTPAASFYLNGGEDITFTINFETCPIPSQAGRIILNPYYDLGSLDSAPYISDSYNVSISAGTYDVTLISFDDHTGLNGTGSQQQPNEKYYLKLFNSVGGLILNTQSTQDIPDDEDFQSTVVNTSLVIPEDIYSIKAQHTNYIDNSDYNSMAPVCALFKPVGAAGTCGNGVIESDEECDIGPSGFSGWWKFDESSGTTATDSSGNGNNGTLTNMNSSSDWVGGQFGNALDFDGSNDLVVIPNSAPLNVDNTMTVSAWIRSNCNPFNATECRILQKGSGDKSTSAYVLELDDISGPDTLQFCVDGNLDPAPGCLTGDSVLSNDNVWHFVAGSWDGTTMRVYVDGNLDGEKAYSSTMDSVSHPLTIGGRADQSQDWFRGRIDDVRVYDVALTPAEISTIYNSDLGGASCVSQGFSGGALGCTDSCTFDLSQCTLDDDYILTASPQGVIATIIGNKNVDSSPTTIRVTQIPPGGFTGNITLTSDIAAIIPGASHNFSDSVLNSSEYSTGSVLIFNIPENVAAGEYTVTVIGSGGGLPDHTVFPALKINVLIKDPGFQEVFRPISDWYAALDIPFADAFSTE